MFTHSPVPKHIIAQKITPQFEKHGFGHFTVIRQSDNSKIGSCGLYDREGIEGIDIGFGFLPQYETRLCFRGFISY